MHITKLMAGIGIAVLPIPATPALAQTSDDYINPDRPGIADGSTTVGKGRFQIETAIQVEFRGDSIDREQTIFFPTLLRLGFATNWEVRVEGNTFSRIDRHDEVLGNTHDSGFAPTSLGLKYNFLPAAPTDKLSLGAIVRVFPPGGSGDFSTSRTTGDARLAADWTFAGKWSLNPNVGIGFYQDDRGRSYAAALAATPINFNPNKRVNLFADMGLQAPEGRNGKNALTIDAGGAYIIGHDVQIDLSIGTGVAGSTPPHPFIAAGVSRRF